MYIYIYVYIYIYIFTYTYVCVCDGACVRLWVLLLIYEHLETMKKRYHERFEEERRVDR